MMVNPPDANNQGAPSDDDVEYKFGAAAELDAVEAANI